MSGIKRSAVGIYFALTFAISWLGALAVAAPHLLRQQPATKMTGIVMFPVMLLGPCLAGIATTGMADGRAGLRRLFLSMSPAKAPARWYAVLLIPPALVLATLLSLERFVSPVYAPNHFFLGILFGLPAGFLEEIGWTGFAFPHMRSLRNGLAASILLGLLWSLWHAPAIDYLGTATPHGASLFPFLLAFGLAMTAMRVLIAWVYGNTQSLWLAQLMHMSSTGSLVVFSPPLVTAIQEVRWYALYGVLLWLAVAVVVKMYGTELGGRWTRHSW